MKLLNCYIEGFGRLRGFSHSFTDGLNVFHEDNGFGKSTLAVFIKAMLYGLPASRSSDPEENERRRYAPWSGGVCGGALSFETGGKKYRAERIFGRRESEDEFRLFSLDTGLPSSDFSAALGIELFGIDAAGYERSTYLSQRRLSEGGYASIQGRLSEQRDLTQFDRAQAILDRRRKYYQMTGNRGRVAELTETLSAERRLIEDAEGERERLGTLAAEIKTAEESIRAKQAERERLLLLAERQSAKSAASLLRESEARLTLARDRAEKERRDALLAIGHEPPSEKKLLEMLTDSEELDRIRDRELAEKEEERARLKKRRRLGLLLLLGALAASCPAILLSLALLAIPAAALLVLSLSLLVPRLTSEAETRAAAKQRKRTAERIARRAEFLKPYLDPTVAGETAQLVLLREKAAAYRRAEERLREAEAALNELTKAHPELSERTEASSVCGDPEKLREDAERLSRELELDRDRLLEKQHFLRGLKEKLAEIDTRGAYLASLEEEHRSASAYLRAILSAEELLTEAKNALTTRYRDAIERSFRKYLKELEAASGEPIVSEAEGGSITISGSLEISVVSGSVTRSAALFSSGSRDLLGLCLRFSIADALISSECPPMVLDDPFVNLDDGRLASAIALLSRLSETRQILYFTCSSSRSPLS